MGSGPRASRSILIGPVRLTLVRIQCSCLEPFNSAVISRLANDALRNALPSGALSPSFCFLYVRAEARTLQGKKTYLRGYGCLLFGVNRSSPE
jgi:hypothetical protein